MASEYRRQYKAHDQKFLQQLCMEKNKYREMRRRLETTGSLHGFLPVARKKKFVNLASKHKPLRMEWNGKVSIKYADNDKECLNLNRIIDFTQASSFDGENSINHQTRPSSSKIDSCPKLKSDDKRVTTLQSETKVTEELPRFSESDKLPTASIDSLPPHVTLIKPTLTVRDQACQTDLCLINSDQHQNETNVQQDHVITTVTQSHLADTVNFPASRPSSRVYSLKRGIKRFKLYEHASPFAIYGAGDKELTTAGKRTFNVKSGSSSQIYESAIMKARQRSIFSRTKRLGPY